MRLLFVSNLFPDASEPGRGIYNARLVRHLGDLGEVRVVSPRAALPLMRPALRTARAEDAAFQPVFPPGWYLPKIGSRVNPWLLAQSMGPAIQRVRQKWPFDAVLASWVYPDGCAVAQLAAAMKFPFGVVAQGSDVHQYLGHPVRRRLIVASLQSARVVVARSGELARLLEAAGVPGDRLKVIYNGVDTGVFHPGDQAEARAQVGLPAKGKVILFVGNLLPIKNPLLALEAFLALRKAMPAGETQLVFVGDGPLRGEMQARVRAAGQAAAVLFAGKKPEHAVAHYMRAADVLCLSSWNEGMPNVVLEALAAHLPVVATRVGGLPEVLERPELGALVAPGDLVAMTKALGDRLRAAKSAMPSWPAEQFSWPATARAYLEAIAGKTGG